MKSSQHEYLSGCFELLCQAGLAISGWPKGTSTARAPSLDEVFKTLSPEEVEKLKQFLKELFQSYSSAVFESNDLIHFTYCMFASFLRFLVEFVQVVGMEHIVIFNLMKVARKYDYTFDTFLRWREIVYDDFNAKNIPEFEEHSSVQYLGQAIMAQLEKQDGQNRHMQQLLQSRLEVDLLKNGKMDYIINL